MTSVFLPQYLLVLEKARNDLSRNYIFTNTRNDSHQGTPTIIFFSLSGLKFDENHLVIVPIIVFQESETRLINSCINSVSKATFMSQ